MKKVIMNINTAMSDGITAFFPLVILSVIMKMVNNVRVIDKYSKLSLDKIIKLPKNYTIYF